jgi:hypothetical protein
MSPRARTHDRPAVDLPAKRGSSIRRASGSIAWISAVLLASCEDAGNPGDDNLLTGGSLVLVVLVVLVVVLLARRRR